MKHCTFCGASAADEARFCTNCGNMFPAEPIPKQPIEQPIEQPVEQPTDVLTEETPVAPAEPEQPVTPAEPTNEQPTNEQPSAPAFIPQQPEYVPEYAPQPEPQRKKRKVLPWILGAAALLVIAGVLVWFFCLRSTPTDIVTDAYEKTAAAMEEQLGSFDNLCALGEKLAALQDAKNLYSSMDILLGADDENLSLSFTLNNSNDVAMGDMTFNANLPEAMYLWVHYSTDGERLLFELPGLYSVPFEAELAELADLLDDSDLLSGMGLDSLTDAFDALEESTDTVDTQWLENAEFVEVDTEAFLLGGASHECTRYRPNCDVTEATDGALYDLTLLVDDRGYLVGLEAETDMGQVRVLLDGKENPCSRMLVYVGTEIVLTVEAEKTVDGCELDFGDFILTIDDEFGMATLDLGFAELKLNYSTDDNGVYLSVSMQEEELSLEVYLSCAVSEIEAEMIAGDTIDVLSLNDEELAAILSAVRENAAVDPDYKWLLELLGTETDLTGDWYWQLDLTSYLEAELGTELGTELKLDTPFCLDIFLTISEDGTYKVYADEMALTQSVDALRTSLVTPLVEYMYTALTEDGTSREEIDTLFETAYEMSITEYVTQMLKELDFEISASDFSSDGTYSLDGETVLMDGEEVFTYYVDNGTEYLLSTEALEEYGGVYMLFERKN